MAENKLTPATRKAQAALLRIYTRALERMGKNEKLVRSVKDGGFSLNDLQSQVSAAISDVDALNKAPDGAAEGAYKYGPWVADIVAPEHEAGETWQAVVNASDGKLYAVNFTIGDDEVSIVGEPKEVARTTDYEFVAELTAEPNRSKPAAEPAAKPDSAPVKRNRRLLYRYAEVERTVSADEKDNTVQVAFSSEYPVQRTASKRDVKLGIGVELGESYLEVLSHDESDADFTNLNNRGAFLDEHEPAVQLGHVRKAMLSKDKMGRAVLEFDEATDLSKARKKQIRSGSRPHISFGYTHTKFVGDATLGDGTIAKRFAFSAAEISSVAIPADPKVGAARSAGDDDDETPDSMAHCLDCGVEKERSKLNSDFVCGDCQTERSKRSKINPVIDSNLGERKHMADKVEIISEADVLNRSKAAAETAVKDILTRNKNIHDVVEGYIKDHGMKATKTETCESKLRAIADEFYHRDSTVPTPQLMSELGQKCLTEVARFPNIRSFVYADDNIDEIGSKYSLRAALKSCADRKAYQPEGFEKDIHDQMVLERKRTNADIPFNPQGFLVPDTARTPAIRSQRDRAGLSDRYTRDLQASQFAGAGALVPTQLMVPIIELLRNRPVLTWAGVTMLGGLTGNVVIPRQTSACAPQAIAEIGILNSTQQTFDQISFTPKRVGNTQFYSRLLVIQSSPDVEALIREDNFRQIALTVDEYGINGQGAGSQPLGILNTPGVNSITFGGIVTLANAILMKTKIRSQNVNDPLAYVTTSASSGKLMAAPAGLIGSTIVSGSTNAIWTGNELDGQVTGTRAFASQQIPGDRMICGAWEHMIWASWAGIQVVVDYVTRANQDEIGLTMNCYSDFGLRHPVAFTASTDSAAQG